MPTAVPDYSAAIEGFTRGFIRAREAADSRKAQTGQVLFEAAKKNPELFDDPTASKAIMSYVGDKDAFSLVRTLYQSGAAAQARVPFEQAKALGAVSPAEAAQVERTAQAADLTRAANASRAITPTEPALAGIARSVIGAVPGIGPRAATSMLGPAPTALPPAPVPQPYAGMKERVIAAAGRRPGASARLTEKGGTSVNVSGPTRSEAGELTFYQAVEARRQELLDAGTPETSAHLQALREATVFANEQGLMVPKEARKLAEAKTQQQVQVALRGAIKAAERAIEQATARGIAGEQEIGQRGGRLAVPISEDEQVSVMARDLAQRHGLTPAQAAGVAADIREGLNVRRIGNEATAREKGTAVGRLAPEAPQPTPAEARTKLAAQQDAADAIGRVFDLFNPEMLGPIAGRVTNVEGALGLLKVNEERFRASIDNLVRAERMATTGQQASEAELSRIKKELLNTTQAPQQFFARLMEMTRRVQGSHESLSRFLKANNEVSPPLELNPRVQAALASLEPAGAAPTPGALDLGDGWRLEPVE